MAGKVDVSAVLLVGNSMKCLRVYYTLAVVMGGDKGAKACAIAPHNSHGPVPGALMRKASGSWGEGGCGAVGSCVVAAAS